METAHATLCPKLLQTDNSQPKRSGVVRYGSTFCRLKPARFSEANRKGTETTTPLRCQNRAQSGRDCWEHLLLFQSYFTTDLHGMLRHDSRDTPRQTVRFVLALSCGVFSFAFSSLASLDSKHKLCCVGSDSAVDLPLSPVSVYR